MPQQKAKTSVLNLAESIRWFPGLISYAARDPQLKDHRAFELEWGPTPQQKNSQFPNLSQEKAFSSPLFRFPWLVSWNHGFISNDTLVRWIVISTSELKRVITASNSDLNSYSKILPVVTAWKKGSDSSQLIKAQLKCSWDTVIGMLWNNKLPRNPYVKGVPRHYIWSLLEVLTTF